MSGTILCIGECMVELAPAGDGLFAMGFAGDTFNTAWYLRRLLPPAYDAGYLSAVGQDATSDRMLAFMADQGIGTAQVARLPGLGVGLYMIHLNGAERSFSYWRNASAARQLAADDGRLARALQGVQLAYLSGITLAILSPGDRDRLFAALNAAKAQGTRIAFDPNMRPALWPDAVSMRQTIAKGAALADIVLPSFDEEALHCADATPEATVQRYLALGAGMVVVKNGAAEVLAGRGGQRWTYQPPPARQIVDTTAAGDSFNAGFLAAELAGATVEQAMSHGAAVAVRVIGARGALVAFAPDGVLTSVG